MKLKRVRQLIVTGLIFLLITFFAGCNGCQQNKLKPDLSGIHLDPVQIKRYEKAIFSLDPSRLKSGLKEIAPEFPVFLNYNLDDTLVILQLYKYVTDPLNLELYQKTLAVYPELDFLEKEFHQAFRYFRYYFPELELPQITTYVSGLLYEMPVQLFDKHMIIALDMYLGKDFETYRKLNFPLYRIERMSKEYILRDGMYEFYYYHFIKKPGENVLEKMISNGKHLYFLDAMLPDVAEHIKIGYPEEKLKWCYNNEGNLWAFLLQNDILYASDAGTLRKFFADGPFTAQFGKDSPARIGEWIGWRIVKSYMTNNREVTLAQLIENDDLLGIFQNSKYKPAR